ncbi:hypothetical protein PR048_002872 [Dryococelus australis]|uniref:Uncharacterized protein n=1 Tax=Dryococelus australis TaxID=614101 RepID=A0ABQ9ILE2_9NEOP|nr:hypothetical protein PR048_002872 [Dryococelus australis]
MGEKDAAGSVRAPRTNKRRLLFMIIWDHPKRACCYRHLKSVPKTLEQLLGTTRGIFEWLRQSMIRRCHAYIAVHGGHFEHSLRVGRGVDVHVVPTLAIPGAARAWLVGAGGDLPEGPGAGAPRLEGVDVEHVEAVGGAVVLVLGRAAVLGAAGDSGVRVAHALEARARVPGQRLAYLVLRACNTQHITRDPRIPRFNEETQDHLDRWDMILDVLQGRTVIIGVDVNAKSELRHSSLSDEKGDLVSQYLLTSKLEIKNEEGELPTYVSQVHGSEDNLDITELEEERKSLRREIKRLHRSHGEEREALADDYRWKKQVYFNRVRQKKKQSWMELVTRVGNEDPFEMVYKIMANKMKENPPPNIIVNGTLVMDLKESMSALLHTLLPDDSQDEEGEGHSLRRDQMEMLPEEENAPEFTNMGFPQKEEPTLRCMSRLQFPGVKKNMHWPYF